MIKPDTQIPIIMLTGFGDLIQASGVKIPDVDLVVSKPITLDKMREMIAKVRERIQR